MLVKTVVGRSYDNFACNHQQYLPDVPDLRRLFDLTGEEFTVPLSKKLGWECSNQL